MNTRHGALIFHLQSRPRTHLFLVTEKHCHARCPCSAALLEKGQLPGIMGLIVDSSGGGGTLGMQDGCQAGRCGAPSRSHHPCRMLWAPCSPGLQQVMWKKRECQSTAWGCTGMSEEGQCPSKVTGAAPPILGMDTEGGKLTKGTGNWGEELEQRGNKGAEKERTWRATG